MHHDCQGTIVMDAKTRPRLGAKGEQPHKRQTAKLENGALGRWMRRSIAELKEGKKLEHG